MPEPNDALLKQLLHTFREEAAEHLDTLNHALLQYERIPDINEKHDHIQNAFRAAHSLKGAARAVSLNEIQSMAHGMETVFQEVRDNGMTLGADQCDLLYEILDSIRQALDGSPLDAAYYESQLQQITGIEENPAVSAIDTIVSRSESLLVDESIRVSLHKLDDLMAEVSELLVSQISTAQRLTHIRQLNEQLLEWSRSWAAIKVMLKQHPNSPLRDSLIHHAAIMQGLLDSFGNLETDARRDISRLNLVTNNLQDKVRRVRMIPFSFHSLLFERVVRDAARTEGKDIRFEMIGVDTELDKRVLEHLKDPLIHLLRNAVSHGIEPMSERNGKPPQGNITLMVEQRGSEVHIYVKDDGRGFQLDKLKHVYNQRHGETNEHPINLAFLPGISTLTEVSELSGRGIGLDIVRERLEHVHGRYSVQSDAGSGTTILLIVPTSLAITRMLLVSVHQRVFAIPLMAVERIIVPEKIVTVSHKPLLQTEQGNIPLIPLSVLLGMSAEAPMKQKHLALIVATGDQQLAVLVDDVITEQELSVKPLGFPVKRVRNVTGAALMGNGDPIVVLNPADFIHTYRGVPITLPQIMEPAQELSQQKPRVLVVDDSITTRTLERNILEAAGYRVFTATDGVEALRYLNEQAVDVVVSDIEMPNMNGFELTQTLRGQTAFEHLPIILVTSLEREQDRERGMKAGANAYIVKRGFDQAELLNIIDHLL